MILAVKSYPELPASVHNIAITITIFAPDLLNIKFFEPNKVFTDE